MIGERTTISLWHNKDRYSELISKSSSKMHTQLYGMPWKSISRSFPMVYIMSKQRIWYTGIIVAWTPAIYICPEWTWKALMSKVPAQPHHPGYLCYHPLWRTICWCYYHWWFRMCCLIHELHIGPCSPAWTDERGPVAWAWSQISIMYIFMLHLLNVALYIDSVSP